MKIVILIGAFLPVPPLRGGAIEKIWDKLGQEFARTGHDMLMISRQYPGLPDKETINGVKHVRVKGYDTPVSGIKLKMLDLLYSRRAIREVPYDADVIITNTFFSPILLRGHRGSKVYIDESRVPKGQMKFYAHAGRYRANSNMVRDMIAAELPARLHHKIGMVSNPLPFEIKETIDAATKEKLILFTGRIHPEKGLELLIEAFRECKPGWKLQVVGPWATNAGGGGEEYIEKLRQMAAGAAIEFTGPVYDIGQLNNYYRRAAVFVYPSLADRGETFGLAPLEGMAWGAVPVVSAVPCFGDFITHNENGLIFNHHAPDRVEQLRKLLDTVTSDTALRVRLMDEAIKVNESHSIAAIADDFIKDFQNI